MTTTELAKPVVENPEKPFVLTAAHRCDRCGAQAYVATGTLLTSTSGLLFCAHHAKEHLPKLKANGVNILLDDRPRLAALEGDRTTGEDHA